MAAAATTASGRVMETASGFQGNQAVANLAQLLEDCSGANPTKLKTAEMQLNEAWLNPEFPHWIIEIILAHQATGLGHVPALVEAGLLPHSFSMELATHVTSTWPSAGLVGAIFLKNKLPRLLESSAAAEEEANRHIAVTAETSAESTATLAGSSSRGTSLSTGPSSSSTGPSSSLLSSVTPTACETENILRDQLVRLYLLGRISLPTAPAANNRRGLVNAQVLQMIRQIAGLKFPIPWPLLPSLVEQFVLQNTITPDPLINLELQCAGFIVAAQVVDLYPPRGRSEETLYDLKFHVLPYVEKPLLAAVQVTTREMIVLTSSPAAPSSVSTGAEVPASVAVASASVYSEFERKLDATVLFAKAACQMIHALISIDLPEAIENNQSHIFEAFLSLLRLEVVLPTSSSPGRTTPRSWPAPDMEGPLEELKCVILKIFSIYASRYSTEFDPLVDACVSTVLELFAMGANGLPLAATPGSASQAALWDMPRYDNVVCTAIKFLAAVARYRYSAMPLKNPPLRFQVLCERIITPNIQLRDVDIEVAQESGLDFARRELEGGEQESRRGAAVELVQSLSYCYSDEVAAVVPNYVSSLLETSKSTTAGDEETRRRMKVVATDLVIALVVQAQSKVHGVTQLNTLFDVESYVKQWLVADLKTDPETLSNAATTALLLRASALKFISVFRNQLSKSLLLELIPVLVQHFKPSVDSLLQTYAAYCVESILIARELPGGDSASIARTLGPPGELKFTISTLKGPLLAALEVLLLGLKKGCCGSGSSSSAGENEYIMRCVARIFVLLRSDAAEILTPALQIIRDILRAQSDGTANSLFTHFMFEAIATLCDAAALLNRHAEAEATLLETLGVIISQRDHDFISYCLQIIGLLLDRSPARKQQPASGAPPTVYLRLFEHLLLESQWLAPVGRQARVPGMIRVINAFLRKADEFEPVLRPSIPILLQRFGICLSLKGLHLHGLIFATEILHCCPYAWLELYLKDMVMQVIKFVSSNPSKASLEQITILLLTMNCRAPPANPPVPAILEGMQRGLCQDFCLNVLNRRALTFESRARKRLAALGLVRQLLSPIVYKDATLLSDTLKTIGMILGIESKTEQRGRLFVDSPHEAPDSDPMALFNQFNTTYVEEFQGTFNPLSAATGPTAERDLKEASPEALKKSFIDTLSLHPDKTALQAAEGWGPVASFFNAAQC